MQEGAAYGKYAASYHSLHQTEGDPGYQIWSSSKIRSRCAEFKRTRRRVMYSVLLSFPPNPATSAVPANVSYPSPAWEFRLITDKQIERAYKRMKPLKATKPGTVPNCVLSRCADLLAPRIGPSLPCNIHNEGVPRGAKRNEYYYSAESQVNQTTKIPMHTDRSFCPMDGGRRIPCNPQPRPRRMVRAPRGYYQIDTLEDVQAVVQQTQYT